MTNLCFESIRWRSYQAQTHGVQLERQPLQMSPWGPSESLSEAATPEVGATPEAMQAGARLKSSQGHTRSDYASSHTRSSHARNRGISFPSCGDIHIALFQFQKCFPSGESIGWWRTIARIYLWRRGLQHQSSPKKGKRNGRDGKNFTFELFG